MPSHFRMERHSYLLLGPGGISLLLDLFFSQCEKLDWKPNNVMESVNLNLRADYRGQGTIRTFSCKSTKSKGMRNSSLLISSCLQIIPGTTSVSTLTLAATSSVWSMPAQESEYEGQREKLI